MSNTRTAGEPSASRIPMERLKRSPSTSSSDPFRHRLNGAAATRIALLLVCGFMAYHTMLHAYYGIDSCKWLLSDGRFQGWHVWQPYGCMLHNYSRTDGRMCMRYIAFWGGRNSIVFVGDSRVRQVYQSLTKVLSTKQLPDPVVQSTENSFYTEKELNLELEFRHLPVLNASVTQAFKHWADQTPDQRPNLIVAGLAVHSIRENNASADSLTSYKGNLTRLLPLINRLATTQVLWLLQHPVQEEKLSPDNRMITNEQIDLYNKAALDVLKYVSRNVHVWSSSRLLSQGWSPGSSSSSDDGSRKRKPDDDGMHMGSVALAYSVQMLLNMYCNDQMNFNDGSCCSDPEHVTSVQILTFVFFGVTCVTAVVITLYKWFFTRRYRDFELLMSQEPVGSGGSCEAMEMEDLPLDTSDLVNGSNGCGGNGNSSGNSVTVVEIKSPIPKVKSYGELFSCLAKVSLIMLYAFVCDRSNFFMKENKYYTAPNYFLPIAYVFALGLFFTEESKSTALLHPDQMDECKGWLMFVILSYNMTGASQVLSIYVDYHLLVTSYLFLFGFQHFQHFWHKGDSGFRRLWQLGIRYFPIYWQNRDSGVRRLADVLFKLNLLTVFLCLTMNRPYQFYEYVPLVTFWYIVIHVTLVIVPQVTAHSVDTQPVHYLYMSVKLIALMSIVTILYMSEVLFAKIFLTRPWKALFVTTDDSISDWWFRWKVDRYAVPAGMTFAFLYEVMRKQHLLTDEVPSCRLFSTSGHNILAIICSLIGISIYASFSFLCRNESECVEIHAYISFLPIVSFIVLRNVSAFVRGWHSTFFAWFGRMSVELFVLQNHVWLTANTNGVLVLVPSFPVLNVLVTLFLFVSAAHTMHSVTNRLTRYAISNDWRYMTRNIVLFLLVLIPIGIKDGMF